MEQEILKPWQKKVLGLVSETEELQDFYLSGGTALAAFYLKHRFSDDLDFFIEKSPDPIFIHNFVQKIKVVINASEVKFSKIYDRFQFFYKLNDEEVKVEFTQYEFIQLEQPTVFDYLKVDSLKDIATNKLMTILDRFDPKDFVDMYFILKETKFDLKKLQEWVGLKFGIKVSPLFLGSELAKVKRVEALPRMLKPLTVEALKEFFSQRALALQKEIIEEENQSGN